MAKEIRPVIAANPRFRPLLPEHGKGSKGGLFESLTFQHGPDLTFLSGKGGDEKRSGITSRVVAVTEGDRLDEAGEASAEAAPIYQMEARTASFGRDARFYVECTSTTPRGFVHREYTAGTASRILCPCPHCGEWVGPEREHLVGWQGAESEVQAADLARWECPSCSATLSELDRRRMNEAGVLVHRGQRVERDTIHGEPPQTRTLGFRANGWNNLFWDAAFIASQEWKATRDKDQQSAERKLRQWYWSIPVEPNAMDITPLELEDVLGRQAIALTKGVIPPGTFHASGAADLRKTQLHFGVLAWVRSGGVVRGHLADLGVFVVDTKQLGIKRALLTALRAMRDRIEAGYRLPGTKQLWRPGWVPIDAYWHGDVVRQFCAESREMGIKRYIPSFGRGLSAEQGRGRYQHPAEETPKKPHVGDQYYVSWQDKWAMHALIVNADHWKTFSREGLATPEDQPGAITTFQSVTEDDRRLLDQFAREVTAERAMQIVVPERGVAQVFVNDSRRPNHFGDVLYNACAAGHLCGVRIEEATKSRLAAEPAPVPAPLVTMPDGRPFFITSRED